MTDHVARLYVLALSLLAFFVLWAAVAAKPWATASPDPRLAELQQREQRLRREAARTQALVNARWTAYRAALRARNAEIATRKERARQATLASVQAPSVRVVTLPPLTTTRSS